MAMSSSNLPYFIEASDFKKFPGQDSFGTEDQGRSSVYPDLSQANGAESMYALADGAMQAHQERNQFANLVQAAEAANEIQIDPATEISERRSTRKRKRETSDGVGDEEGDSGPQDSPSHDALQLSSAAAALFRKPSVNSKKYTRMPMSQLYSKLELSPENFLELQSKAKAYMLDPENTDRQDTVGQRGKGDSEHVKLRLWNCVKIFLEELGNGSQFFGPNETGEHGSPRTMVWPQDKTAIISAVTPLMRRMVTNERQRKYAIETRKGGDQPEVKKRKTDTDHENTNNDSLITMPNSESNADFYSPTSLALFKEVTGQDILAYPIAKKYVETFDQNIMNEDPTLAAQYQSLLSQSKPLEPELVGILASIDHHLRNFHLDGLLESTTCSSECESQVVGRIVSCSIVANLIASPPSAEGEHLTSEAATRMVYTAFRFVRDMVARTTALTVEFRPYTSASYIKQAETLPHSQMKIRVSHVCSVTGARFSRREISAETAPYLHTIAQVGVAYAGPSSLVRQPRVRVLGPGGLKEVKDDKEWEEAISTVRTTEWLDGVLTVLVDYGANSPNALAGAL